MGTLLQDIRYALRGLRKSPGFAATVILTLALGIGANTAIFSLVDAVLLRTLPYREPERLVRIVDSAPGQGLRDIGISVPELQDLRDRSGVFEQVSATWPVDANVTGSARPERIEMMCVGTDYFAMLGATAQVGRLLGAEDKADGFAESVVISDGLWRRLFGADPKVLGTRVRADNDVYVVVGVMPPGFRHPGKTVAGDVDLWSTAGFSANPFPNPPTRARRMLPGALGRLKPGIDLRQAQERINGLTAVLTAEFPNEYRPEAKWAIELEPLRDAVVGNVRPLLLVLLGAVTLMLLIGCVNIANLLLARASGRQREVAIRQALGAARGRLIRQWLTESVMLSLIAGIAGVLAASWTLRLFVSLVPAKIPRLNEVSLDWRVMLFGLLVSVLTGVLFGLAPAMHASSGDVIDAVKETNHGTGRSRRHGRTSEALVVAEFAICLVLMIGAGMLLRSFWHLIQSDPGFNPHNVLAARVWLPQPNDPTADPYARPADRTTFTREVLRRAGELPGITSAAMTSSLPLAGRTNKAPLAIEGYTGDAAAAEFVSVSPSYFTVMGTPLYDGRVFLETDQPGSQNVAIVDRATAQRYWPGQSALGKRVKLGGLKSAFAWATVVGVVGNIRHDGLDADSVPHVYLSIYQRNGKTLGVVVRGSQDPASLGESLRRTVESVDPTLPVYGVSTMTEMISTSLAQRRFSAQIVAVFAGVALLLAAIGVYGVLAYSIGQRTREFGIRMALGAHRGQVIQMVLWQGMKLILAGVAAGLVVAAVVTRAMSGLLYGVSAVDPLVFSVVPLVLLAVAFLASYLPAYRATRIDPMVALRD